jgi:hypothetical protein
MFGQLALTASPSLGLEPVDRIDDIKEAAAAAGTYSVARNGICQIGLAGSTLRC